jgi:hypothetical protein
MELGEYRLVLEHPLGTLEHSFLIDYPIFDNDPVVRRVTKIEDNPREHLLMGFPPHAVVTLLFFNATRDTSKTVEHYFIASRQYRVDENGALLVIVNISRSAPFDFYRLEWEFRCPNSPWLYLAPGAQAYVLPGDPNALRDAPESDRVQQNGIPAGGMFIVLEGPVCGETQGLAWYKVNYQGAIGWTAVGEGSTYWIEKVD